MILYNSENNIRDLSSPVATGRWLVCLAPQTKLQAPPNWNIKHYKSVEFLSNLNVKPHLHKRKTPYWRLSGDGSWYKAILSSIVLSQQCCKVHFISLTVAKPLWGYETRLTNITEIAPP